MECGSCGAVIPDDSIFCSECGARQEVSRAGSFSAMGSTSLGGGEVTGGRGFGVVSGEAVRQQREMQQQGMPQGIPADILQNIASGIQQQNNLPPGSQLPPQQPSQFPNQMSNQFPQQQPIIPQGQQPMPQGMPTQNVQQSDLPQQPRGPTLASGAVPSTNVESQLGKQLGGTTVSNNPTASPTDAMVNHLAETERAVKNERRNQWLNMNQSSASNVLANLGADLPSHLRDAQGITPAAEVIAGTMGQSTSDGPNDALLRRMCEVASRRVARKRGVAVETPEAKVTDGVLVVNLTYVDDGRVLDTPEDLSSAFEHAIQTEVALKGYDMAVEIVLKCMKDGEVTTIGAEEEDDEEMFACEVCDGLVKESDPKCPHCGAIFEEEEEEEVIEQSRKGPPGPSRSGPPGPSRSGPPGPSRSGPPGPSKSGPPRGGPKKGGGPPGPSRSGPPGPSKGGPPKGGPSGPSKGGPPGPKKGGPPGPSKGGPPGPKKGGPPGPSKGGPPGPSKSGPPGPKKGGPPKGGPKKGGPPGPKRGPPN